MTTNIFTPEANEDSELHVLVPSNRLRVLLEATSPNLQAHPFMLELFMFKRKSA
jgi:hypothetical protein